MIISRFRYQIVVSGVYVWSAGTAPITGFPFIGVTLVYLVAMAESFIPSLVRSVLRR